jgi:hypothetical protein
VRTGPTTPGVPEVGAETSRGAVTTSHPSEAMASGPGRAAPHREDQGASSAALLGWYAFQQERGIRLCSALVIEQVRGRA